MKGFLSALCFLGATTGLGLDGVTDPPKAAEDLPPPAAAAPAAPTETERLLLERIEKLEKRLAEMESGRNTSLAPAPTSAAVIAPTIASTGPPTATKFVGTLPSSLQAAPATPQQATVSNEQPAAPAEPEPFGFADFTWLNGNSRETDFPLQGKYFTGEVYADGNFTYSMNHPADHTLVGSSEIGRVGEFQVEQFGIGGDFHMDNVHARLLTQFGVNSTLIPRNDASPARGQFQLQDAFRYVSEAYGGYHFNVGLGLNVDYGIFMSYIGLFSYYQYENWAYQPSYVSSNTPWFFQGLRTQFFPSDKLKLELWVINGWQSYGVFNNVPGVGTQLTWRPNGNIDVISNNYFIGKDTLGNPDRKRMHTDDSIQVKYYQDPLAFLDMAAFSLTFDAGCEYGGGVTCSGGNAQTPSQYFLGFMAYNRVWFANNLMAVTLGGGYIDNPGRYLVLLPAINGATAISGTPYFTENPGQQFKAWDWSFTLDYMPSQWGTIRAEFNRRFANTPYFAGAGGITPPGGNQGAPGSIVPGFTPDLVKSESRFTLGLLVRL